MEKAKREIEEKIAEFGMRSGAGPNIVQNLERWWTGVVAVVVADACN